MFVAVVFPHVGPRGSFTDGFELHGMCLRCFLAVFVSLGVFLFWLISKALFVVLSLLSH